MGRLVFFYYSVTRKMILKILKQKWEKKLETLKTQF